MDSQPLLHCQALMDFRVIDHHIEPRIPLGRILQIENREQIAEQGVGFGGPKQWCSVPVASSRAPAR